jgi:hypothetical protein
MAAAPLWTATLPHFADSVTGTAAKPMQLIEKLSYSAAARRGRSAAAA